MHEVLLLGVGIMIGTVSSGLAVYLGGHLVLRTYIELTQSHLDINNTVDSNTTKTSEPEGYDWDEYDNYIVQPLDEEGSEPEA